MDKNQQTARDNTMEQRAHTVQAADMMQKLYKLFIEKDCTQVEINPVAESTEHEVLCMDAKLNFDDNAEFRQKDIFALRDTSQEDS
ncbi:10009_t:CDS:2, partial [Entrophospora sp. SA101]